MVIYDSDREMLFIPEKTDQVYIVTEEEIYAQGFNAGYRDGMRQAEEDCQNNNAVS